MVETKLNIENKQHQLIIGVLATFVEDYGYHPRQLMELLDDAKNQLFFGLLEIYQEKHKK